MPALDQPSVLLSDPPVAQAGTHASTTPNQASLSPALRWVGVLWGVTLALGLAWLAWYGTRPAPAQAMPATWPADLLGPRLGPGAELVVFVHPRCPCTRASLAELADLRHNLERDGVALQLTAVVYRPASAPADWAPSEHTQPDAVADAIAPLTPQRVVVDRAGALTAAGGVSGSGTVWAYAADGSAVFVGGLTPSRGHRGITTAHAALHAALQTGRAPAVPLEYPVYGCPIVLHEPAP